MLRVIYTLNGITGVGVGTLLLSGANQLVSTTTVGGATGLNTISTSGSGTKTLSTTGEIRTTNLNTAATTVLNAGTSNTITTLTADAATTLTAGTFNTVTTLTANAATTLTAATANTITTLTANIGNTSVTGATNSITTAHILSDTTVTTNAANGTTIGDTDIGSGKTLTIDLSGGTLTLNTLVGNADDTSKVVINSTNDLVIDLTGAAVFGTTAEKLKLTTGGAGLKTMADLVNLSTLVAGSNVRLTGTPGNNIIDSATINAGKNLDINGATAIINGITAVLNNPVPTEAPITVTSSGALTVTDGSTVNFNVTAFTNSTTKFNLIDASTGGSTLTVDVASLIVTDNSALLNFNLERIGDIVKYSSEIDPLSIAPGSDSAVVGAIVDIQSTDPTFVSARNELIGISDSATLSKAVKDLQKEQNGSLANESINATYISRNILNSRTFEVRNSATGFAAADSQNAGVAAGDYANSESGIWGQVYGGSSKYKKSNEGYDSTTGGLMFGVDKKSSSVFGDKFQSLYGIALSYSKTNIDDKETGGQGTDINSYYLALYNSNFTDSGLGLYNNNTLHSSYHDYSTKRSIVIGNFATTASADFSGLQLGATTEFGYGFKAGKDLLISPNAGLSYVFLKQEDYQEKGAGGIGLNVNNNNINSLVSTLGVKAASKFSVGNYRFLPQISALWLHNLTNSGQKSTSSFIAGGSSFRSNSADLPENTVDFGLLLTAFKFKFYASSFWYKI